MDQSIYRQQSNSEDQSLCLQEPNRRHFLKMGIGFSVALACASIVPGLTGCSTEQAKLAGFDYLTAEDIVMFRALLPIIVTDFVKLDAVQRNDQLEATLHNVDAACHSLMLHQQKELRKLFDLMAVTPIRWMLTGVGSWHDADAQTLQNFLQRWRSSRFGTLNVGVNVLIKLCAVSYFSMPVAWSAAGYPGPLASVFAAVNAK